LPAATLPLLVGGADNVLHGDAALRPGALHLGEVDAEFLGLLLCGVRGLRLLLLTATCCLLSGLLTLLDSLSSGILRLTG
jgi:hypothetical protein